MRVVSGYFSVVKVFLFSIFIFTMVGCSGIELQYPPNTYHSDKVYIVYGRSCPQFYGAYLKSRTNNINELFFELDCDLDDEQYVLRAVDAGIYNNFSHYKNDICENYFTGNFKNLPSYEFQAGKIYYLGHFNTTQGQDYIHFNQQMDKYVPYKPMPNRYEKVVLNRQIIDKIIKDDWGTPEDNMEVFSRIYLGVFSLGMSEVFMPYWGQSIRGSLDDLGYNEKQCKADEGKFSQIIDAYKSDKDFSFELECTKEKIPENESYSSLKIEDNFMVEHQKINDFVHEKMSNTSNIAVENMSVSRVIYEYYPIVYQYCPSDSSRDEALKRLQEMRKIKTSM